MTIDHFIYIYNHVIMPRLLYQLQCITMSRKDCHRITSRERSIFKSSFKLHKNTKNEVLYSSLGPCLAHLYVKYIGQLLKLQNYFLLNKDFFWINGMEYVAVMNLLWYPYLNNQVLLKVSRAIRVKSLLLTALYESAVHSMTLHSN